jgi:hypothetical protein
VRFVMQRYLPATVFVIVVLGIALAMLLGMPALLALVLVTIALCGYSIASLRQRLVLVEPEQHTSMQQLHGRQLAGIAIAGLVAGAAAILLPARPGFAGLLLLALISAAVIGLAVREVTK